MTRASRLQPRVDTPPIPCLSCRVPADAATGVGGRVDPGDGEVAVCGFCGHVAFYVGTPPTGLRQPTPEEMPGLQSDLDVRERVQQVRRRIARQVILARRARFRGKAGGRRR